MNILNALNVPKSRLRIVIARAAKEGIAPARTLRTDAGIEIEWSNGETTTHAADRWVIPRNL